MNTIKFTKYHIFGPNHLLSLLLYGYNYNDKIKRIKNVFCWKYFQPSNQLLSFYTIMTIDMDILQHYHQ